MKHLHVLCLGDETSDREPVAETFRGAGLKAAFSWVNGQRDFEIALGKGGFDAVIGDVSYPDSQGAGLIRCALSIAPDVPFIVLSRDLTTEQAVEALRTGASDYVLKSEMHRLAPAVMRAIREGKEKAEKRATEELLRLSQEQFASAFENAAIGMALFGLDWKWFRINRALCDMLGYSESELLTQTFAVITHPEDIERNRQELLQIMSRAQDSFQIEKRYRHRSGTTVWGILNVSLVADREGNPSHFISQVQDITSRKEAELKLRDTEERYRAIFDRSIDAVFLQDRNGRCLDANPAAFKLLGYQPDEIDQLSFDSIFADEKERDRAFATLHRLFQNTAEPVHSEYRLRRKDGKQVWVEVLGSVVFKSGEPFAVQGIARDVTARKEAEEAVRASEERYRSIVQNEPECVKILAPDGTVLEMNPAGAGILCGCISSSVAGRQVMDFIHEEDRPLFWASHLKVLEGERQHLQFRINTTSGETRWMESHSVPLRDAGGNVRSVLSLSRDVSSQREAELEKQTLLHNLRERVKELRALHEAARTLSRDGLPVAELLRKIASITETAMQYPEVTGVRISFGGSAAQTPRFKTTPWVMQAPFAISNETRGLIEIAYIEERPAADEGPFLAEERSMLESLAEMLSVHFEREHALEAFRESNEHFAAQHAALTALTRSRVFQATDLNRALQEITETVAATLKVGRVSVWLIQPARAVMRCEDLFEKETAKHSSGLEIRKADHPVYFEALHVNEFIAADDARNDPRTLQFAEHYLKPAGISSMLDVPIRMGGELAGVLCLEATGAVRAWTHAEKNFTLSIANLVSLTLAQWQQVQAEAKMAEQGRLLDHARDAIFVQDLGHRITYWNFGAERTYGWTAEEAVGKPAGELLLNDPATLQIAMEQVLRTGEWSGELEQVRKDKRRVLLETRWSLMKNKSGSPYSILSISTDVTDRKKLETQFLRAQRMESLGTLAGGIAHDLNNVLAPIQMGLDLLKAEVQSRDGDEMLRVMATSVQRGSDLVKQMLSFARGSEGRRVRVDLGELLAGLYTTVRKSFPKTIHVHLDVKSNNAAVIADPSQLDQVFLNLCINARDSMPDGGKLLISVAEVLVDELYSALRPATKTGHFVVVSVADTGTGIPVEIRDQIFDPFFTTKEPGKGTGLGLSTTQTIVHKHGGFIDLDSEVGSGSVFKIYLPAAPASSPQPAGKTREKGVRHGQGQLILVVDDDENVRIVVQKTLERHGYRVAVATNGAEAVSVYALRRDEIAAVLTDMIMPVMDGPSLMFALKSINPGLKIVAFSGYASESMLAKASAAGVEHFIPKPYTAETMLGALSTVLQDEAQK